MQGVPKTSLTNLGFASALVIFALLGVLSYFRIEKLAADNEWVIHTHEVIESIESLSLHMASVQSEVRGYVATGDPKYIAPYREHAHEVLIQTQHIRKLTADNSRQQQRMERLAPIAGRLLNLLEREVSARSNSAQNAQALILTGGGLEMVDDARNIMAEMMEEEKGLLADRDSEVHTSSRSALRMLLAGGILALLIIVFATVQVNREFVQRQRAQVQIEQLNLELKSAADELSVANRDLEAFTYSVAHDLRAPLRHIDGFSAILQDDFGKQLSSDALDYLNKIREGAGNMGRLIEGLLKLSRLGRQELNLRRVELKPVIDKVIRDLAEATENRRIQWHIGEFRAVECDLVLVEQVFTNLLSNAVKYTRPRDPAIIDVHQILNDGEFVFVIRDNGVGFDMKYSDKLFGVFQRLHLQDDFEGTGIGLATVERIVRKHGGRIWAEAEINKGAVFSFTLPS